MALLYIDSFSHCSDFSQKGWVAGGQPVFVQTTGRHNNAAYCGNNAMWRSFTAANPIVVGFAFNPTSIPSGGNPNNLFYMRESGGSHLRVMWDNYMRMNIYQGNGTLLASLSGLLTYNAWSYFEFKLKVDDTNGGLWVRQNGADVARLGDYAVSPTTLDTRNGGSGVINDLYFGYDGSSNVWFNFQDLYVLDTTGSANNDFLGDVRVDAIFPSGNGNSSQLVGSDGNSTDNYALVDETSPSTADYVESSTAGDKDTYAFGDMTPASGSVFGVQINAHAAKTDAGDRSIVTVARLSGTEVDSSVHVLTTTPRYYRDLRETKPGGGAWSISDVNSAEFGVKVNA